MDFGFLRFRFLLPEQGNAWTVGGRQTTVGASVV